MLLSKLVAPTRGRFVTARLQLAVVVDACLGHAYAKLGEREKALEIAATLTERYQKAYASPVWIAVVHVGLGDRPRASSGSTRPAVIVTCGSAC